MDVAPTLNLRELERRAIVAALEKANGNVTTAAKLLGLSRATLYRRLANMGLASGGECSSNEESRD